MSYALITGASKGIGKAIAALLAQKGTDLLLVARSAGLLETLAAEWKAAYGVNVFYFSVDLTAADAPQMVFDWCLQNRYDVSILVNNAGFGLAGAFEKFPWTEHRDMLAVNMITPVHLVHTFLPMLRRQPEAFILNIVSTSAYQALPGLTTYAASKAFMLSFSRALQFELRKSNVFVTAVSPGSTDTDFVNRADMGPKARKNAEKFNMTPEKVAAIAIDAMYARKVEVITGFTNKLGAALAWILPKRWVESTAAGFYD